MNATPSLGYAIFQAAVIVLVLAWSLWFSAKRLFPRGYRAVVARLAKRFSASPNAALHAFGERITPQQIASGAGCGSGGGCSNCGTCAAPRAAADAAQPLIFRPRAKL